MQEVTLFGQVLSLEARAMHVASGGSVLYDLTGEASGLAHFLSALREEIAYGIASVSEVCAQSRVARVAVYFGSADLSAFMDMLASQTSSSEWEISREDIAEGTSRQAYSISARQQVIEALG